ncbi:chloride channel protein [Microvirga massiliensis]|uniref:chloride channel protein n=1 Tax=Microvirga massiliensis TaxID=1033741 RepID=UPI00062BCADE|nr:chloride channel protein [Microvirga massiliensis]
MWTSPRWRPYRTAWLSSRLWKRRLILLAGAVMIGLAATVFAGLSDLAQHIFRRYATVWPWAPLVVTPIGFALMAYATQRWFDGAQGSGIPQVIAARRSHNHRHRAALLSARVTIGKIILTLLGFLAGASIGREGPTVQVGAAIMFAAAGLGGIGRQRGLVLAGAAAGVAAAFNAPLAGVLFAIEELAKAFERRMTALITGSVVLAGLTSLAILGNYSYFGAVATSPTRPLDWLAVPICATVGGVFGGLFSRGVAAVQASRNPLLAGRNRVLFAAACGLVVAVLALATNLYAAGTGYAETRAFVETGAALPWWYAPAKLVTTLLSSVSGIPGGLFSPSLSVGAGFGSLATAVLPGTDPRLIAVLAMVGYFAAVVQSPLTAFVIVMEMTSDNRMVIPLMATALLAAGLSRLIAREPLYHALSYRFDAPVARPQRTDTDQASHLAAR